jgi:hypothetical protein
MWKVNGRRMPSDGKSSHCLWQRWAKKLGPRTRINYPVFSDVGILNIENRVHQLRLNHIHKFFYGKGPKYKGHNFNKARDLHHHSTRGKHYNFVVPNVNGMTSTTFYFNAIKDWNSLPIPLKSTKIFQSFKSGVKEFIINRCRECIFKWFLLLMNVQKSSLVFKTRFIW